VLPGGFLSGVVLLPVAIAFGAASWYLVERPIMRRAARLPRAAAEASGFAGRTEPARARTLARA